MDFLKARDAEVNCSEKNGSTKPGFVKWNERKQRFFPEVKVEMMEKMQMNLTVQASLLTD